MPNTHSLEATLLKLAASIKDTFAPSEIAKLMRLIGPTPSTGELTPEQFERLMSELKPKNNRPGYSAKSIEVAHLVLVMGASVPEAAAEVGLTPQGARQLMARIRRRMAAVPDGWRQVSGWFPAEVAKQVEKMSASLKSQAVENKRFTVSLVEVRGN